MSTSKCRLYYVVYFFTVFSNQNDSIEINAFRWPQHQIQDFLSVSVKSELLVQLYKGYGSKMLLEMTTVFENGEKLVYVFKDERKQLQLTGSIGFFVIVSVILWY